MSTVFPEESKHVLHERLGAECLEQSGLEVESKEKPGSQDGWAQVRPHGLWEESPERGGQEGQARRLAERAEKHEKAAVAQADLHAAV